MTSKYVYSTLFAQVTDEYDRNFEKVMEFPEIEDGLKNNESTRVRGKKTGI